jgi:hypothetical protein
MLREKDAIGEEKENAYAGIAGDVKEMREVPW